MIALLTQFWPAIAGAAVALLGILFGFVKSKSADTKVAQAAQTVAETQAGAERSKAQTAQVMNAEAQANAAAASAGSAAAADRATIEAENASKSSAEVQNDLNQWRR